MPNYPLFCKPYQYLLLIIISLLFQTCKKDEVLEVGDVTVLVLLNGYAPVENAVVYTNASTLQGKTDLFGSVLLKGISVGSYEIFATLNGVGSGKATVNVKSGELTSVTINIIRGIEVNIAPRITLLLPSSPAEFYQGENITFSADIKDDKTPPAGITVKWESNLDGALYESSPDSQGNVKFSTAKLSRGHHQITVTAKNSAGHSDKLVFPLSTTALKGIKLNTAVVNQGNVELEWERYSGSDFLLYEVYRTSGECGVENPELIASFTTINSVKYIDNRVPFEYQVCYFVKIITTDNQEKSSNELKINSPAGHIFSIDPNDMLKHPTSSTLFFIDKGSQKLIKYDYSLSKVVQETRLQGNVGFCDIGDNGYGVEIYVPSSDGWIYVYNAENLDLVTTINTGLPNTSVVTNGKGIVIVGLKPSPWWEKPIRTYKRSNGLHIDGNGGFDGDRLRIIPGKNETISISTSVSPIDMEYMKYDDNGNVLSHVDDTYHGDHPLNPNIFRVANNGEYSITGVEGAVYTANSSMQYRGMLQRGSLEYADFAFSDDGSIIYAATSNRKSVQIGHYPSLQRSDEILTRGYPKFIIRDKKNLILLSRTSSNSMYFGIEIIAIE